MCFSLLKNVYDGRNKSAQQGDKRADKWIKAFNSVAAYLEVKPG
jgi:hypothetical protein